MLDYAEFLRSKRIDDPSTGLTNVGDLPSFLKPHQHDITGWALRRGRAGVFAGTGLGKTLIEEVWAQRVADHTGKPVLIFAPLAVSAQHIREAKKFGLSARIAANASDVGPGINVTNYQKMEHFDLSVFGGVVLDESSILKSQDGHYRTRLIEECSQIPFRLAATATPAPNDYMELGNHAEFLGVMSYTDMLATFFVHDGGETQQWRLKGHAEDVFWKWMASWSVMLREPADLGYPNDGYDLPPLIQHQHTVGVPYEPDIETGLLFPMEARSMSERISARKATIEERVAEAAALTPTDRSFMWWCNLNAESDALTRSIPSAVEIRGSESDETKERKVIDFVEGRIRVLVSKPSIVGFGMNFQHCADTGFVGLNDSFEQVYQAVRRFWRFGQTKPVNVHFIAAETEGAVVANIKRKEIDADRMAKAMIAHTADLSKRIVRGQERERPDYCPDKYFIIPRFVEETDMPLSDVDVVDQIITPHYAIYQGDACELIRALPDESIDFGIHSPPFVGLYKFSNYDRDISNNEGERFWIHYSFLIRELLRVTKPGRLHSVHVMQLPTTKTRDGFVGMRDFRGETVRAYQEAGWIFHSEVCIWKDPVVAQQRTKSLRLLHKQIEKDSTMSGQGMPDYVVTFRKPGENACAVDGQFERWYGTTEKEWDGLDVSREAYDKQAAERRSEGKKPWPFEMWRSVLIWQRYASPVWTDIDQTDTLQFRGARDEKDEQHIAPLQLDVIRRCLDMWSNPGDTVLTPFLGIGSEVYCSVEMGRKAIGFELKPSYFAQARKNLEDQRAAMASGGTLLERMS